MAVNSISRKKVLIVDDSVFARKFVSDIISSSPRLEVIAAACNGEEALSLLDKLRPDVITLDIEMPGINGLETLKRIMCRRPTPVVMLSSLTTNGADESIRALTLGAVDVMAKPHGSHSLGLTAQRDELIAKILAAADVKPTSLVQVSRRTVPPSTRPPRPTPIRAGAFPVVMIASSTGGPRALRTIVPELPTTAGAAYVFIQHLPEGFSGPLARDLNLLTELSVRESSEGDLLGPGDAIIAKAGYHTVFERGGKVSLTTAPTLWGVRPSADVTMVSAVPIYGSRLIGVVLTGMGRDGANGMTLIRGANGATIAEHESTCVVYGMPRVAIESGVVDTIAPLLKIPQAIHDAILQVEHKHRRPSVA